MAEEVRRRKRRRRPEREPPPEESDQSAERRFAQWFARLVPVVGLAVALAVGARSGLGPALLALAATALIATVALLWASLRTLSGDAPLAAGFDFATVPQRRSTPERKREALRALKDLELEHSLGKIDEADYHELERRYREEAKSAMREIDAGLGPRRERAEEIVQAYLEERGLGAAHEGTNGADPRREDPPKPIRVECAKCSTSNEADATFCKKCGASLKKQDEVDAPA